jgi:hypothetical protein
MPDRIPTDYLAGYEKAYKLNPELTTNYVANAWVGDPLADALVDDLSQMSREDSDRLIQAGIEQYGGDALRDAPESFHAFFREVDEIPSWVDFEKMHAGTRMFYRAGKIVLAAFTGGTLVEGFSTNIAKSFFLTGRLRDQGVRRLKQNNRHMLEIFMPGGMERHADGWTHSVRVRLVHAKIRYLLKKSGEWDEDELGTPISSAHLGFAISSFSARLLRHLKRLGASFSGEERESFMAVWRYSGYLMGIPETILFEDEAAALRVFEIGRLCEPPPSLESVVLASSLINSAPLFAGLTESDERRKLAGYIGQISRALIGKELADQLHYPSSKTFGVLGLFRLQERYHRLAAKLFRKRVQESSFSRFTSLLDASGYDEGGITYGLPDHAHAEESSRW